MVRSIVASKRTNLGIIAPLNNGVRLESTNNHLVFSAVCVRGDVVLGSVPLREAVHITSSALTENLHRCTFPTILVFARFIGGRKDDYAYDD
jgi:hypothetical protein